MNRIDEIIIFDALDDAQIRRIVDLRVKEVVAMLLEHQVTVSLTDAAKDWLAKEGFDPVFGARPLRRAIQRHVENPLSKRILAGDFVSGDHVVVDAREDQISFEKSAEKTAPAVGATAVT